MRQQHKGNAATVRRLGMNPQHPCSGCGRAVAYRTPAQRRVGAGKHRVRHNCPHGVPCVFGEPYGGQGWNGPALGGRNHCPQCVAARKARRDQWGTP